MTFFPASFDPRAEVTAHLNLVSINAPSGIARFIVGIDGSFTDIDGNVWVGSSIITTDDVRWSRDGSAPAGNLSLTYFRDPDGTDLISELRETGDDVLRGREIKYYLQPISEVTDFYAPKSPPLEIATRTAGALTFEAEGDTVRRLSLAVEGPFKARSSRRNFFLTREDHERLIGESNPSLSMVPTESRVEELLAG